jgi:hypothetical protein
MIVKCVLCAAEYHIKPSQAPRSRYCSRDCQRKGRRFPGTENLTVEERTALRYRRNASLRYWKKKEDNDHVDDAKFERTPTCFGHEVHALSFAESAFAFELSDRQLKSVGTRGAKRLKAAAGGVE